MTQKHPVIVVGGGIAGLTTALALQDQGRRAIVYEAAPRVGGRIHSVGDEGTLETGMQFYYSSYAGALGLLRRFGLTEQLRPIHVRGQMAHRGRIAPFDKAWPWLSLLSARDNLALHAAVARLALPLLRMSPFDYRAGEPLDELDAAVYFQRRAGDDVLEAAIRPMVNSYAFTEPEGHSLAMLMRILRLGAMGRMYGLVGGNDQLPARIAQQLEVRHARVDRIVVDDGQVRGVVVDGVAVEASQVVCAVRGPHAAALLGDVPALWAGFAALPYSSLILVNLHLDRALTGPDWSYVMSRTEGHRTAFAVDLMRRCPAMFPDGHSVLQAVFADPVASQLREHTDEQLAALALADLEPFVPGVAQAVRKTSVVRRRQALPSFSVGMFDQVRQLQQKARRVRGLHLAGDYLRAPLCEGAVQSAYAAAQAVVRSTPSNDSNSATVSLRRAPMSTSGSTASWNDRPSISA